MRVLVVETPAALGSRAAEVVLRGAAEGSVRVLGVSTGSSPVPVYEALGREEGSPLGALEAFALDEYVGLPYSHPESYHSVVTRLITRPFGMDPARVHVPDGLAEDLEQASRDYEEAIRAAGGVDLQILGIGRNGHIGFNEPGSSLASRTRVVTLAEATREDNSRFFGSTEEVPVHALTQGVGTILDARRLLFVAHGTAKARAVALALEGPVSSMCPGSALQLHPDVTVILDEDAASGLALRDYHRFVAEHEQAHVGT